MQFLCRRSGQALRACGVDVAADTAASDKMVTCSGDAG